MPRIIRGLSTTAALTLLLFAVASPAGAVRPVRSIEVDSTVFLGAQHSSGMVRSSEQACVAERLVVVKYRDKRGKVGVFGHDVTDETGKYFVGALQPVEGTPPFEFFAVAKARTDEGKGRSLLCKEATSKVRVVAGT